MLYGIQTNSDGIITSKINWPESTLPKGYLEITAAEYQQIQLGSWQIVGGEVTPPPAPTAAQLLEQSQTSQTSALKQSYRAAISSCPVTINGTAYTLALDTANAILNLSAAMSAQQALAATAWTADADVTLGQLCSVSGVPLFCSTAGKTGSTAPTVPSAIGTPVADGTASWELFTRSTELCDGTYAWFTAAQTVSVGQQVELYLHSQKTKLIALQKQVGLTETIADVKAVIWN